MLSLVVFLQGWFNSKGVSIRRGQLERQVVGFSVSGLTSHLAQLARPNTQSACLPDLHSLSVESCQGQAGGFRGINHLLKPCNPATSFPKLASYADTGSLTKGLCWNSPSRSHRLILAFVPLILLKGRSILTFSHLRSFLPHLGCAVLKSFDIFCIGNILYRWPMADLAVGQEEASLPCSIAECTAAPTAVVRVSDHGTRGSEHGIGVTKVPRSDAVEISCGPLSLKQDTLLLNMLANHNICQHKH